MARCSYLHPVDPGAVTFESEGCRHLIAQHVDDQADDFFILPTVRRLKDFSRTHLVGIVGAGIAYLQMIRDGYVWCDHFEKLTFAGTPPTKRSPDFAFNRPGETDVAITESKATHGSSRKQFTKTVRAGYQEQVAPYLGLELSGAIASHGYSIGSWMTSATRAELLIDHTAQPVCASFGGAPSTPRSIRRGNYLTVLSLMFGPDVAIVARSGAWPPSGAFFRTARWLDREWLLGFPAQFPYFMRWAGSGIEPPIGGFAWRSWLMQSMFALELDAARTFFRSLKSPDGGPDPLAELPRLDDALIGRAREAGGAVYPDGFAVLGRDTAPQKIRILRWDPQDGEFVEHAAMEQSQSFTDQTLRTAERSLQFAMRIQKVDGEKNIVHLSP